jgi:hypothetical protein
MGACSLEAFLPGRHPQYFVPSSLEDRCSQEENLGVIVDNEYFGLIFYSLPLI